MNINFDGQVALVTGGTRGIGWQMAQDFERLGAKVWVTGTSPVKPAHLSERNFEYIAVDFSIEQQVQIFLEKLKTLDRLDICVNNAGINRINPLQNIEAGDYRDMMAVNLDVPFKIIQTVAPIMQKRAYGRIVNISSIFGKISMEKRTAYSMTKFGLKGLTVATSIELARQGILVNTVSPGFTLTDLTRKNLKELEIEALSAQIPARRLAEVHEISHVVTFLCSRYNSYMCGQDVVVDGGFTNV
ncbi:MAG TPA: SDR family oxidoreductase [Oligoflexus sp.]|uniref:SDR family NAD(P)-dependent oxidoreductase n=1 Tax=Oligoflexus sp. TaxID=1971216 RepID=UPI002D27A622|nr:SDR family oxidoreductase [Oligoflexus sp.]HYX35371.1 SDR family oxidoreductase [Oligoflexus sp.]